MFKAVQLPANFVPYAIMKDGKIPGSLGAAAAIYADGKVTVLGRFDGEQTIATSVNSLGQAVGYSISSHGSSTHALEFENGRMEDLGHVDDAYFGEPLTINAGGEIYGTATTRTLSDGRYLARFRPGIPARIHGCFQGRGLIYNVNDAGVFSETGFVFQTDFETACGGTGIKPQILFPQYAWSTATWVNDAGTLTGSLSKAANHPWYPRFAYTYQRDGTSTLLPSLNGSDDMEATAINNAGSVIGMAYKSTDPNYAHVFYYASGAMHDITKAIFPQAPYVVSNPGLSNTDEFIAATYSGNGITYFLIEPTTHT